LLYSFEFPDFLSRMTGGQTGLMKPASEA